MDPVIYNNMKSLQVLLRIHEICQSQPGLSVMVNFVVYGFA